MHLYICIYVDIQHTYVCAYNIYIYIYIGKEICIYINIDIQIDIHIYTHISAYIAMYLYRQTHLSLDLILCMPSAIYMHVYCRAFIYLYTSNSHTRHGYSSYVAIYLRIRIYIKSIIVTELYTIHIYIYIYHIFICNIRWFPKSWRCTSIAGWFMSWKIPFIIKMDDNQVYINH